MQHKSLAAFQKPLPWHMVSLALDRDSPDESQTGVNIRAFPAFPQDIREVRTAISASPSAKNSLKVFISVFRPPSVKAKGSFCNPSCDQVDTSGTSCATASCVFSRSS